MIDPLEITTGHILRIMKTFNVDLDTAYNMIKTGFSFTDNNGLKQVVKKWDNKNSLDWAKAAYNKLFTEL